MPQTLSRLNPAGNFGFRVWVHGACFASGLLIPVPVLAFSQAWSLDVLHLEPALGAALLRDRAASFVSAQRPSGEVWDPISAYTAFLMRMAHTEALTYMYMYSLLPIKLTFHLSVLCGCDRLDTIRP